MKFFHKLILGVCTMLFLFQGNIALGIDDKKYFPATNMEDSGMVGKTGKTDEAGDGQALLYYIPMFTNILTWAVAPIIAGMFIFAGIQFIYAGGDEEQLNSSKQFFQYGIMGIIFIFASYSLMLAVYKIISS